MCSTESSQSDVKQHLDIRQAKNMETTYTSIPQHTTETAKQPLMNKVTNPLMTTQYVHVTSQKQPVPVVASRQLSSQQHAMLSNNKQATQTYTTFPQPLNLSSPPEWKPNHVSLPTPSHAYIAMPPGVKTDKVNDNIDNKPMDLSAPKRAVEAVYPACEKLMEKMMESLQKSSDVNQNNIPHTQPTQPSPIKPPTHTLLSTHAQLPAHTQSTQSMISHSKQNGNMLLSAAMTLGEIQECIIQKAVQEDIYDFEKSEGKSPAVMKRDESIVGRPNPWNRKQAVLSQQTDRKKNTQAEFSHDKRINTQTFDKKIQSLLKEQSKITPEEIDNSTNGMAHNTHATLHTTSEEKTCLKPLKKRALVCEDLPQLKEEDDKHRKVEKELSCEVKNEVKNEVKPDVKVEV